MFSVYVCGSDRGSLQYRKEFYTGISCRISPDRLHRNIGKSYTFTSSQEGCPFCPDEVLSVTPVFPDGSRIMRGESITFPNLFPFSTCHVVTVITREHLPETFTSKQISDALSAQAEALRRFEGYPSINWNYLPSAGASIVHPHMQGISDPWPSRIMECYLRAGKMHLAKTGKSYWDAIKEAQRESGRYLFGEEIYWYAQPVPIGEREIRGIIPVTSLEEFDTYIDLFSRDIMKILGFYRRLGTHAFNLSLFFEKDGKKCKEFSAFCSLISRINPNSSSTSDSAFMERIHREPVILTLPEELGRYYRNDKK
jgi:galactose-1-phosphate uridylyltransferase